MAVLSLQNMDVKNWLANQKDWLRATLQELETQEDWVNDNMKPIPDDLVKLADHLFENRRQLGSWLHDADHIAQLRQILCYVGAARRMKIFDWLRQIDKKKNLINRLIDPEFSRDDTDHDLAHYLAGFLQQIADRKKRFTLFNMERLERINLMMADPDNDNDADSGLTSASPR